MVAERTSAAETQFVDATARRVVELLERNGSPSADATAGGASEACLTVSQVAARYRVSRSWVYAHQGELGAMRLGEGPRARLRFDAKAVADAIAAFDRRQASPEAPKSSVGRRREMRLIQFERLGWICAPPRSTASKAGVTLRHANGRPLRLSPKTINHAIDLLSAILGAATRDEELDLTVNPADDRRLRVKIPKRSARDFLEADEVLSLLVAGEVFDNPVRPATARAADEVRQLRDHEHLAWKEIAARMGRSEAGVIWLHRRRAVRSASPSRAVIALLAASGARNTEACDLRWSDLDFTHGKINVSRSKTKRGVREIDMIPWLREELLSFRAAVGTPELDAPVFSTRGGAHRTKDNLNRNVIRPVVRAANAARDERGLPPLPVAVTAHTFRRTYVTLMLEAGAPLTYVQHQVGHEDTKTTQEIYARVLRRQQRAKVGAAFNELMYGARELAFRAEDETRSDGGGLLMRSPFEDAADVQNG